MIFVNSTKFHVFMNSTKFHVTIQNQFKTHFDFDLHLLKLHYMYVSARVRFQRMILQAYFHNRLAQCLPFQHYQRFSHLAVICIFSRFSNSIKYKLCSQHLFQYPPLSGFQHLNDLLTLNFPRYESCAQFPVMYRSICYPSLILATVQKQEPERQST